MTLGEKVWRKRTISKRLDEQSYDADTSEGTLRRNRVYLRKMGEKDDYVEEENYVVEVSDVTQDIESEETPRENVIRKSSRPRKRPEKYNDHVMG